MVRYQNEPLGEVGLHSPILRKNNLTLDAFISTDTHGSRTSPFSEGSNRDSKRPLCHCDVGIEVVPVDKVERSPYELRHDDANAGAGKTGDDNETSEYLDDRAIVPYVLWTDIPNGLFGSPIVIGHGGRLPLPNFLGLVKGAHL